ncbi:YVTN family beta-propeller protein [Algoriphagus antarcticus]|uniref:YVTN family beta-propeller protein n=2 Tax=Algoriphagus antarcticus TaxID=238540 RepID=A0A3E0DST8_9BACT|nr:YVTN family beta-propeller protein [Algoriphagus antarcticus]
MSQATHGGIIIRNARFHVTLKLNYKHMKLNKLLWASALISVSFACSDSGEEKPLGKYDNGILIMNEGNFGTNDGEVYYLNPNTEELLPNIFEAENLRPFAGLLEDMVLEADRLYLVANTGKVEIVNPADFKSLGAVSAELDQPRSLAVNGSKLFISDYGPYDASYATPDSYVAVVNGLDGGVVSKKIEVSDKPEDLFSYENYIFVASSEANKIEIIDATQETVVTTIELEASPKQFNAEGGILWVYAIATDEVIFYTLNLSSLTLENSYTVPVANATNRISFDGDDKMYILTSSGYPDYNDAVVTIDIEGNTATATELMTGSGFYGIGFDDDLDQIYVANSNGFQGNGTVTVLSETGSVIRSFEVGRGPSGFLVY